MQGIGMISEDSNNQAIRFMIRRLERLQSSRERGKETVVDTDWLEALLIENLHLHERCNRLEYMLANHMGMRQMFDPIAIKYPATPDECDKVRL